jgi:hypothetical protein
MLKLLMVVRNGNLSKKRNQIYFNKFMKLNEYNKAQEILIHHTSRNEKFSR